MSALIIHSTEQRAALLNIARQAIESGLQQHQRWQPDPALYESALCQPGASFVTLLIKDELRGCIGSLTPLRPLCLDVAENAYNAAFRDPRFTPLSAPEWPTIDIHLSIIGASELLPCQSETELLAVLRPGEDGLILDDGVHRATFLPSVWEQLPAPRDFVRQLKRKAGLASHAWSAKLRCYRYQVESFASDR